MTLDINLHDPETPHVFATSTDSIGVSFPVGDDGHLAVFFSLPMAEEFLGKLIAQVERAHKIKTALEAA
jgi:hypothetical protein